MASRDIPMVMATRMVMGTHLDRAGGIRFVSGDGECMADYLAALGIVLGWLFIWGRIANSFDLASTITSGSNPYVSGKA